MRPKLIVIAALSTHDGPSFNRPTVSIVFNGIRYPLRRYLVILSIIQIFFFSYAVFEVPSNVFLKRLRPSIWLSFLMFFWGVTMVLIDSRLAL